MRYHTAKYNPEKDIRKVNPLAGVDLAAVYESGNMPAEVQIAESRYNQINDPDSIMGRPADAFEAAHLQETISSYKPPKKEGE